MDEKNRDDLTKQLPIRDLKIEPEAEELLESAAMQPYMALAMAMTGCKDTGPGNRRAYRTAPGKPIRLARCVGLEMGVRRF
jgi:hypothetical protein